MTIRSLLSSFLLIATLVFTPLTTTVAQDSPLNPTFLIARPELPNELFEKSVILMLPSDEHEPDLVVGMIVNKPTRKRYSDVFPKERSLRRRTDSIYFGGPVGVDMPGAIFRAPKPPDKSPEKAFHVVADVYVTFDSASIVNLLKGSKPGDTVRVFLGRAQWSVGQLQNEMLRRAWYRESAEPSLVFTPSPEDLWQTLVKRAESGPMALLQASGASDLQCGVILSSFAALRQR